MLNKERMMNEVLHVGLYDLVLQDVQKIVGKEKPTKAGVGRGFGKRASNSSRIYADKRRVQFKQYSSEKYRY